ncbi:AraC family transcriptional regulator [bacterium]|nr:AraC family transcriptional regulator [bacterium]
MTKNYQATGSNGKRIIVVVVPPVDEMDLVGLLKVLGAANRLSGKAVYEVEVVTNKKELVVQGEEGLLSFAAHGYIQDVKGKFDSVLLVCGLKTRTEYDPVLFAWMKKTAPIVRRFGSVCVASFLLAEAGLLDGKRATTHWKFGQEMANRYPRVKVESEPIWVKDGNIYTSAGISAGIDLALAWVEEDCGVSVAQEIARELVLFLRRSGKQKQVSVSLAAQASEMKAIQELQVWIRENVHRKLTVQILADRVAMSVRNFERMSSANSCGSSTAPARTNGQRSQTDCLYLRIRKCRCDATRFCTFFRNHSTQIPSCANGSLVSSRRKILWKISGKTYGTQFEQCSSNRAFHWRQCLHLHSASVVIQRSSV